MKERTKFEKDIAKDMRSPREYAIYSYVVENNLKISELKVTWS
jgi:hypothetical protein